MSKTILVLNAGSSSIKLQLFAIGPDDTLERQLRGKIDGFGARPRLVVHDAAGAALVDRRFAPHELADAEQAQDVLGSWLLGHLGAPPLAVGHRVVHGGSVHAAPVRVDASLLEELERLVPLAPLHQPGNLGPIRSILRRWPDLLQIACFDTAFHRGHDALVDRFALPEWLYREGVRRYGFHGLSYEYVASRLPELAPEIAGGRVVVAHLGNGASMCALVNGRSVDSTMGFTALDGLPMGTRPGQLDPGVLLYLVAQKGMDAAALERLLYHESGLLGLSGVSNDVRELLASPDPRAAMALDFFAWRIAQLTGALAATMGGIDGFVFTAGVGENAAAIRAAVARRLAWLGLDLDAAANARHGPRISRENARIACYVVPTDEELMIARHALAVLRRA